VVITLIAWALGLVTAPAQKFSLPDFKSVCLKLDVWGALKLSLVPSIIAILFTDLFDSISTFIGVAHAGGLLDKEGHPSHLREGLIVDSLATMGAGLAGTSSGTAYIESIAGIEMGGRTGLTSVFTALCFLPCLFIAPLAGMVPPYATAAVLILVGAAMFRSVAQINFSKIEEGIPAFLTLILIPLPFSITQGSTAIAINQQASAIFQTGTSSGRIRFKVSGITTDGDPTTLLTIPASAISLDTVTATRRTGNLDIAMIGFDNTYSAGGMTFTFLDITGQALPPGAIRADFTADFRAFFTTTRAGSAFQVRISFPVTGDTSGIGSVDVQLANSAGVKLEHLVFQ
jgi:hypothetical protein